MSGATEGNWRLFCLPKIRRLTPVTIGDEHVSLLELVAGCFDLVLARDERRREIFLSHQEAEEDDDDFSFPDGDRDLRFPTGWSADIVFDEDAGVKYRSVDPVVAAPLISAFPDAQVSKFFRLSEFRPGKHAYDYIRLSPDLVEALDEIRLRAGRPVTVVSGYRPCDYNRKLGGASNSTHIDGLAADIASHGLSTNQLREICEEVIGKRGAVFDYPKSGFVHVDLRGYEARWTGS
jgi:hypothetical protein